MLLVYFLLFLPDPLLVLHVLCDPDGLHVLGSSVFSALVGESSPLCQDGGPVLSSSSFLYFTTPDEVQVGLLGEIGLLYFLVMAIREGALSTVLRA